MASQEDIDKILQRELSSPPSGTALPTQVPDVIEDKDLIPRLAQDDKKRLIEYKIRVAAKDAGFDPHIAAGIGYQESGFQPDAISKTGVKGPLQVSGIAAKDVGFDPNEVRNDVDANIRAGIAYAAKNGIEKYPDPKDAPQWVPNVLAHAETSRNQANKSIDDILAENGMQPSESTTAADIITPQQQISPQATNPSPDTSGIAGKILAADKSYLDALGVGFGIRQLGKIPGIPQASEAFYNLITPGPDKTIDERAREMQGITKQAQEDNPISSGIGTAAGILAPIGAPNLAGKAVAKAAGSAPTVAKLLLEGAAQAGTYEGVSNPETSAKEVGKAALLGGATNLVASPITKLLSKGLSTTSEQLINYATGSKIKSGIGNFVAEDLGPTLTRAGLKDKAAQSLITNEAKLQSILNNSEKTVNLRKIAQSDDLLKQIETLDNVEDRGQATKILNKLAKFELKGDVSVAEANVFKRDLWKQAYTATSEKKTVLGKFYRTLGHQVMTGIEDATGDPQVRVLNRKMGDAIQLGKNLERLDNRSPFNLRNLFLASTAKATMGVAPALSTTAGATTVGTALNKASKIPEANKILLNTLLPQAFQ